MKLALNEAYTRLCPFHAGYFFACFSLQTGLTLSVDNLFPSMAAGCICANCIGYDCDGVMMASIG